MEYQINMNQVRLKKRFVMQLVQKTKMFEYPAAVFFAINKELLLSFFSDFLNIHCLIRPVHQSVKMTTL